ncbi:hypothetical protein DN752_03680 [Echinicola strongylocentroti]|uniref:Alpha/beta hydrolase n=1 Tax=Echinicola strongylocentroti TaxID=1795355 RepID=A0A2Z4IFT8_9BACT|nr:alpha/beta hydrolase [Echinicola strongylocentroti]AWW29313.1 hypothetical protein DN752_03680 [Echinicola strongylocentroti]
MKFLMIFWSLSLALNAPQDYHAIEVPFVYGKQKWGWGRIYYTYETPYDPKKNTVLVVSDALTFYSGDDAWPEPLRLKFNVVKVIGREQQPSFGEALWRKDKIDWSMAYQVFNSDQLVKDLEAVREAVAKGSKVSLFGVSSSGELLHRYMAQYPKRVYGVISIDPLLLELQHSMGITIKKSPDESLPINTEDHYERGENVALAIRCFEHLYGLQEWDGKKARPPKNTGWIGEQSMPVMEEYARRPFQVKGIHYDQVAGFEGKSVVFSGVADSLADQRVDQVLAAHYHDGDFFLFNDGHGLPHYRNHPVFIRFIQAFLEEDIADKQHVYQDLWKKGMIYPKGDPWEF